MKIMKRRAMNNRTMITLVVVIMFHVFNTMAREIRSPLPVWRFYNHYPVICQDKNDCPWSFDAWGAGYVRTSDSAFKDFVTFQTDQLSALFFDQTAFVGINAFAPGSFDASSVFLQFAQITPRICYNEKGAFFGFNADHVLRCSPCWHVGVRANIPYRNIKNELFDCCDLAEDRLEDFCRLQNEQVLDDLCIPQVITQSYAYRLDFLSALPMTVNAPVEMLVQYFNDRVEINDINVGVQPNPLNSYPIHVIQRDDGTPPGAPFAMVKAALGACPDVDGLPNLDSNGNGAGGNNQRAHFTTGTDYLPLGANPAAQRRLWVVPTAQDSGGGLELMLDARTIRTAISSITQTLNTDVLNIFAELGGISFASQKTQGAGDLLLEFYGNRLWGCDLLSELFVGVRFPTGVRIKDPGKLLAMPTGNNGHFELYFGGMQGYHGSNWLHAKLNVLYGHAFSRTEKVGAPFTGATVKNIGPAIDARIAWDFFVGDLDFTFLPPCCPCAGIDIGYQLYVKSKDHVSFSVTSTADLFGVVQTLDANVIEKRTNVLANKVKTEVFYQGECWETFAGWHHVFAGRNASKETDWYLGFVIYF
jgi:hypothetical protein